MRSDKEGGFRVILVFCLLALYSSDCKADTGTTPYFKDIVVGKCWDYVRQKSDVVPLQAQNCSKVWEVFSTAFLYKDPCTITDKDYDSYFDLVRSTRKLSKTLFWSGTYKAVHDYSDFDLRFTTLEDTLPGYIVNGLNWCGSKTSTDGLNYTACPECGYSIAYWAEASERFAKSAEGVVYVMVNGSRKDSAGKPIPAYSQKSFFGSKELPNIDVSQVHKMSVIVVHTPGGDELESCGQGSIKQLVEDCKKHGIKEVTCMDDPDSIQHILCADYPEIDECKFYQRVKTQINRYKTLVIVLGILLGFVTIIAVLLMIFPCIKYCRNKSQAEDQK